jgi:tRNA A37 threonylcarbamoyladenosine dehydratase
MAKESRLSADQIERYSRQILVPDLGGKSQIRLLHSRVLVIGAGGLGSPAAFYLAAAGIGTLGIVDQDTSNYRTCNAKFCTQPRISAAQKPHRPLRDCMNSIRTSK